jgi:hypothetical protein
MWGPKKAITWCEFAQHLFGDTGGTIALDDKVEETMRSLQEIAVAEVAAIHAQPRKRGDPHHNRRDIN